MKELTWWNRFFGKNKDVPPQSRLEYYEHSLKQSGKWAASERRELAFYLEAVKEGKDKQYELLLAQRDLEKAEGFLLIDSLAFTLYDKDDEVVDENIQ